ncbi:MAG: GntR family transcriptional regulator, partial [Bacillota bacterium]|nr:GntR family transcriptional regulator [Bacillota bacterium]
MIRAEELLDKIGSQNEVYNTLKYHILTLKIEPGEMLSESIISSQMNAGRPAVRDALAQLTEE